MTRPLPVTPSRRTPVSLQGAAVLTLLFTGFACGGVTGVDDGSPRLSAVDDSGAGAESDAADGADRDAGSPAPPPSPRCGNGRVDPEELCDGTVFESRSCSSITMGARGEGALRCGSGCDSIEFLECGAPGSVPCEEGCGPVASCAPAFCPSEGPAPGCCVAPDGPCGVLRNGFCGPRGVDGGVFAVP